MKDEQESLFTPGNNLGLTHSDSFTTVKWGFQLLEQCSEQRDFVSVRKSYNLKSKIQNPKSIDGKPIATLDRHQGAVWGVGFSPQTHIIASVSRDDTIKLWRLDGTLVKTIAADSRGLRRVAFSPDGRTIATAGVDNTVKLWSLDGKLLTTLSGHRGMVISLAFTANGKYLVSGGDDSTVMLWDIKKILTLNKLEYGCNWVQDYLRTNVEVTRDSQGYSVAGPSLCKLTHR